ncbi:MAG: FKBP-type peptidyl-prolyl cis-trans isomerase [Roseburia sp.]|nr:FKBP-type peptidyl-prolyl cis-trans isomerase [Roseburia sp.]
MKKRLLALLLCMTTVFSMAACGDSKNESTEGTENATGTVAPAVDLGKYDFNYADYVTLPDYTAIPIELAKDYEVTEEDVDAYILEWFEYYKPFYMPDEMKTVVAEGDIVNVDYVGKLEGVAFDGGTATDQDIDVSGNCSAGGGSSYIEGFTAGLLGAQVGDVIDCDVTFPANYGATDLAGKAVVFTFTVNSIQKEVTFEEMDDAFAKKYGGADTLEGMYAMVRTGMVEENAYYKMDDSNADIQKYLLENSTVDIPADYFDDMLKAYRNMYVVQFCEGDESKLEEYLSTEYQLTVDQAEDEWRGVITTEIKLQFILGAIAKEVGVELNTEGYETELANYVSYYGLETAEPIFAAYGYGDPVFGEKRMKEMYVQADLLEKLTETADITIAEPVEEVVETTEIVSE